MCSVRQIPASSHPKKFLLQPCRRQDDPYNALSRCLAGAAGPRRFPAMDAEPRQTFRKEAGVAGCQACGFARLSPCPPKRPKPWHVSNSLVRLTALTPRCTCPPGKTARFDEFSAIHATGVCCPNRVAARGTQYQRWKKMEVWPDQLSAPLLNPPSTPYSRYIVKVSQTSVRTPLSTPSKQTKIPGTVSKFLQLTDRGRATILTNFAELQATQLGGSVPLRGFV